MPGTLDIERELSITGEQLTMVGVNLLITLLMLEKQHPTRKILGSTKIN